MWPWGHLAVGYLCFVGYSKLRGLSAPSLAALLAVGFGTQFPDLVDKPLAWTFEVLPSGRSLGHSLLVAAGLFAVAYWIAARYSRPAPVVAFSIGHLSHIFTDLGPGVVLGLLRGDLTQLQWTTYLLWPVLDSPPYPHDESFIQHFVAFSFDPYVLSQLTLFVVAVAVWLYEGAPGLQQLRDAVVKQ